MIGPPALRLTLLPGAVLPEHPAGGSLGHAQMRDHVRDAGPAAGGAHQFPAAASLRISFSKVRSATAFLSRVFSASSSFSRRT